MEFAVIIVFVLIGVAALVYFEPEGQNRPSKPSEERSKANTLDGAKKAEKDDSEALDKEYHAWAYNSKTNQIYHGVWICKILAFSTTSVRLPRTIMYWEDENGYKISRHPFLQDRDDKDFIKILEYLDGRV